MAGARALWRATGTQVDDFEKPISWCGLSARHALPVVRASGMFTDNSLNRLTGALGLALPGNGTLLATHADREQLFVEEAPFVTSAGLAGLSLGPRNTSVGMSRMVLVAGPRRRGAGRLHVREHLPGLPSRPTHRACWAGWLDTRRHIAELRRRGRALRGRH